MNWLLRTLEALYRVVPHRCIWTLKAHPTGVVAVTGRPLFTIVDECTKCTRTVHRDGLYTVDRTEVRRWNPTFPAAVHLRSASPASWGSE